MNLDPVYTVTVQCGTVTKLLRNGLPFTHAKWIRRSFDTVSRIVFDTARKVERW